MKANIKRKESDFFDIVDLHLVICNPVFRQRVHCFRLLTDNMPDILPGIANAISDADEVVSVNNISLLDHGWIRNL